MMSYKSKKIAIVSDAVYLFNKGGKEKRSHELMKRMAAEGYAVTFYCMHWWPEKEKMIIKDDITYHALCAYHPLYSGSRRSLKQAIFFAINCLKLLKEKFDIIEVDHIPHLAILTTKIVCLVKRKKMIAVWHEVWGKEYWKKYLGKLGSIAYLVEKISVILPDRIISVSEHTTKKMREVLGRDKAVATVPNGLDISAIQNISPAKAESDIVFVGRLLSHKNVDTLLRAVDILKIKNPEISLVIIGSGPEEKRLKELARDLNIEGNVTFAGFLNDNDKYATMFSSNLLVLMSDREGFGITVIEANACGLPVVTLDHKNNAAKELVVDGENGKLCTLDKKELADTIEQVLNSRKDPEFYVEYSRKYDWNNIMYSIKRVYDL